MVRVPFAEGTLEAVLDEPEAPAAGAVVLCHPHPAFGGRMDTPLIGALARGLAAQGHAALRFHYRGIEGSQGVATGGQREDEDVAAAHAFLVERGHRRVAWVGYSFGALVALRAISRGGRPIAYAGIAIPTEIIGDDPARIEDVGRALGGSVPALFIAGGEDSICDTERLRSWCAGRARATVETMPGEGHGFSIVGIRAIVTRVSTFLREIEVP